MDQAVTTIFQRPKFYFLMAVNYFFFLLYCVFLFQFTSGLTTPKGPVFNYQDAFRGRRQSEAQSLTPLTPLCTFDEASNSALSQRVDGTPYSSSLCSWTLNVTSQYKRSPWLLSRATNAYFLGGPPTDASGSTSDGYVLFDSSSVRYFLADSPYRTGWFVSSVSPPTGATGVCFQFSYDIHGLGISSLRVVLLYNLGPSSSASGTSIKNRIIWEKNDTTDGKWRTARVTFTSATDYQIALEAIVTDFELNVYNYRGYVAVDNTQFFTGPCRGHCNFDANTCSWSNMDSDDFDWSLGWGSTSTETGPPRDHIDSEYEVGNGGYLFINSQFPRKPGDRARLLSPMFHATTDESEPRCLNFWISEYGLGIGNLTVSILEEAATTRAIKGSTMVDLWKLKTHFQGSYTRDRWYPAQLTVSSPSDYRVVIEATVGESGRGDIAIDDISFEPGVCACVPSSASLNPADCAFLHDECGWTVERTHQSEHSKDLWSRVTGLFHVTQPQGHTQVPHFMTDGYMKFDTNFFQHNPLDRSRLVSSLIPAANHSVCLGFWVQMTSAITTSNGLGALEVLEFHPDKKHDHHHPIWRLENHQGSRWFYAQVSINLTHPKQGIRGVQVLGLIAVDDITMFTTGVSVKKVNVYGSKQAAHRQATNNTTGLTESIVTSFLPSEQCRTLPARASVHIGDCAFDTDLCLWISGGNASDVTWQVANPFKAPSNVRDHTFEALQIGFAYYDPFTPSGKVIQSYLESAEIKLVRSLCLTFWFMIYGADDGAHLSVSKRSSDKYIEIWRNEAITTSPEWRYGQVALPSTNANSFKVVFKATSRSSTVILDDIKFYDEQGITHNCRRPNVFTQEVINVLHRFHVQETQSLYELTLDVLQAVCELCFHEIMLR